MGFMICTLRQILLDKFKQDEMGVTGGKRHTGFWGREVGLWGPGQGQATDTCEHGNGRNLLVTQGRQWSMEK
jgi:hypothetical protein